MKLEILFFASLKEIIGHSKLSIDTDEPVTVKDLLNTLIIQFPKLQTFSKTMIVSVNQEFADHSKVLTGHDEIAIFPPVSGG